MTLGSGYPLGSLGKIIAASVSRMVALRGGVRRNRYFAKLLKTVRLLELGGSRL